VENQGPLPNPLERIRLGSAAFGAVLAVVATALAIGSGLGFEGVIAIVAGVISLYLIGALRQAKLREALYESAFAWRRLARDADPIKHFGIRPWSGRPGRKPPPFVRRNRMGEIEQGLDRRRLVLLTGPRTSGKSRLIYEATKDRPETTLIVGPVASDAEDPFRRIMEDRRGLAAWEGGKILFVRDFAKRIVRRSVTADLLRSWLEHYPDLSIIATVSPEDVAWIKSRGEEAEQSLRELKDLAQSVEIEGKLKGAELEEAERLYSDLDRNQQIRLPRYLIADHPLRERWANDTTKHGLGSSLVRAAAAWRRVGLARPAPERFLRSVLSEGRRLTDEEFRAALAWALEPIRGKASLLYRKDDPLGDGEPRYEVDPVVLDLLEESGRGENPISHWILEAIYEEILKGDVEGRREVVAAELITLGEAALATGRNHFGLEVLTDARYLGNPAQKERCARAVTAGTRIASVITALVDSRRGDSIAQRIRAAQSRAEERQKAWLSRDDPDGPGRFIAEIYARRIVRGVLRLAVLISMDLVSAFLGLAVGLALRTLLSDGAAGFDEVENLFLNFLPAWGVATVFLFVLMRLYEQDAPRARFGAILQAAGTLGVVGFAAAAAADFDLWPAAASAFAGTLVAAVADYLLRRTYDAVSSAWVWKHSLAATTLLIGSPKQVALIEKCAEAGISRPTRICGYLAIGEPAPDEEGEGAPETPCRGTLKDFAKVVVDEKIGRVLIADWTMSREKRQAIADRCHLKSLLVEAVPSFADIRAGTPNFVPGQSLTLIRMVPLWQSNAGFIGKRIFDVALALVGLILLAPFMLFIALVIFLWHRQRPVTVTVFRHGAGREVFGMYRFKTAWDPPRDPDLRGKGAAQDRPTPFGKWLRRHRFDELPQLLNVLRGHMSLVGPRPLRMSDDVKLEDRDLLRYAVRPGATGPWQITDRESMSLPELTALDMAYLRNWSIAKDIEILVKTVGAVLRQRGRQRIVYGSAEDIQEPRDDLAAFG
jgi:lipopolysaccharide/colanic/teichoic acid biosynthesis glycosyltransferase